jgi:hypothetical protein
MTLKESVARRDGLMAFVAKGEKLKAELNREREEFAREKDREGKDIARQGEELARAKESFAREVDAWDELQKEAQRPQQEFEQLTKKHEDLCQELERNREQQTLEFAKAQADIALLQQQLTEEKKQHQSAKEIADASLDEISELSKAKESLSKELNSLKATHARDISLLESARTEIASLKRERKTLKQENQDLLSVQLNHEKKITKLEKSLQNQKVKISGLEMQISKIQPPSFSLSDPEILDALSREPVEFFHPPRNIVTLGFGPLDEDDFDNYLIANGKQPMTAGPWIIVGREGWTEQELDDLLDQNEFDEIRVFSQELFMAGILTTHDPFSLPTEILMKFAEGHPALEYIISLGFEWPEIVLDDSYGESQHFVSTCSYYGESPLTHMGYRVGNTRGLCEKDRRDILKSAFEEDIPDVGDDDYMAEWGLPAQPRRLWKIADHLKREAEKRKNLWNMQDAVDDWAADSEWLKLQFYTRRMRFPWPEF